MIEIPKMIFAAMIILSTLGCVFTAVAVVVVVIVKQDDKRVNDNR